MSDSQLNLDPNLEKYLKHGKATPYVPGVYQKFSSEVKPELCFVSTVYESFTDYSNRLELDVLLVRAYESIIARKLTNTSQGDIHHILPTCLGGSDTDDNKVRLIIKDHAKAHCLLQAMFVGTSLYKDLAGASRLTNCRV